MKEETEMIFTGADTPYAQKSKEKVSDKANVGALLCSDTQINDSLVDIITTATRTQTYLEIIKSVCKTDDVDAESAVALINSIVGGIK